MEKLRRSHYRLPVVLFGASLVLVAPESLSREIPTNIEAAPFVPSNASSSHHFDEAKVKQLTPGLERAAVVGRRLAAKHVEIRAVAHPTSKAKHATSEYAPTSGYWFGEPKLLDELDSSGRHNAAILYEVAKAKGLGNAAIGCLDNIATHESHFNVTDANSEGAYGIPQALPGKKMASAGSDWATNPATQEEWMIGYVEERYGDACNAWDVWQQQQWY